MENNQEPLREGAPDHKENDAEIDIEDNLDLPPTRAESDEGLSNLSQHENHDCYIIGMATVLNLLSGLVIEISIYHCMQVKLCLKKSPGTQAMVQLLVAEITPGRH